MKRRTFLGALLATVAGYTLASKSKAISTDFVPQDDCINIGAHDDGNLGIGGDGWFMEFGTRDGMAYQYLKCGDSELTMYVLANGNVGLAQTSPSALLHVFEGGDLWR